MTGLRTETRQPGMRWSWLDDRIAEVSAQHGQQRCAMSWAWVHPDAPTFAYDPVEDEQFLDAAALPEPDRESATKDRWARCPLCGRVVPTASPDEVRADPRAIEPCPALPAAQPGDATRWYWWHSRG